MLRWRVRPRCVKALLHPRHRICGVAIMSFRYACEGERGAAGGVGRRKKLHCKFRQSKKSSHYKKATHHCIRGLIPIPFLSFLIVTKSPTAPLFIPYLSYKWLPYAALGQGQQLVIPGKLHCNAIQTHVKGYDIVSTEVPCRRMLPMA